MKTVNFGYTDTPISGVTSLEFERGLVNFGADFRVKTENKSELILTNITSPIDRPEKFRIAHTVVDNIYNGTGISESVQLPSLRGVNVLVQLTEVVSITDDTHPEYRKDAPLSFHVVIKSPAIEQITEAHIATGLGRLVSGLFETGSVANTRLRSLLRGSLSPTDI